jgi:hypothetical protein
VEDRIRQAKTPGCANLPFNCFDANAASPDTIMASTDLVAWAKPVGFTDHPELARCEIAIFRYRLLHAVRITRSGRQLRLRIDSTWRWALAIATAWAPHPRRFHLTPPTPDPASARTCNRSSSRVCSLLEANTYRSRPDQ